MNIFLLDKDIKKCARYHCDKHVIKMLLEYAQILCTVCNQHGSKTPYKSTHQHHPCVKWAGASRQNWLWLRRLVLALNREYRYRYARKQDHAAAAVVKQLTVPDLPRHGLTAFPQAMPKQLRNSQDPVMAYRNYYCQMKSSIATWKKRRRPKWWLD